MDHHDHAARLRWLLSRLEGARCFSTLVGEGDDYALVLHLGERQRRSLRLANPHLSFLQRTYEGSMGFLVECPWRVEFPEGVAATCFDGRSEGQPGREALAEFEDRTVEHVEAEAPGYDLVVRFSGGWVLRAFALETDRPSAPPPAEAEQAQARRRISPPPAKAWRRLNWSVWTPEGTWVVGARGGLEPESGPGPTARTGDLELLPDVPEDLSDWRARRDRRPGSNDE